MERLLEIKVKDKLPYIILKRELVSTDFAVINGNEDKPNSIRWIMDDEEDWLRLPMLKSQPNELYSVLKIRFLYAVQLYDALKKLSASWEIKIDAAHWSELSNIKRILKRQVHALTEEGLEKEQEAHHIPLYEAALKSVSKSINEFNLLSMKTNN